MNINFAFCCLIYVLLCVMIGAVAGHLSFHDNSGKYDKHAQVWWVCGISIVASAALMSGVIGIKYPFAQPISMGVLTFAFSWSTLYFLAKINRPLPPGYGINAAILTSIAPVVGFGSVLMRPLVFKIERKRE